MQGKEPLPYKPPEYELADATAMQALARGEADAGQQQRVLNWLLNPACGTYDMDYRADPRDHAFVSGRRFIGLCIVKMLKLNTGAIAEAKRKRSERQP